MIENRRFFRFPFRQKVVLCTPHQVISGVSSNLSLGGMLIGSLGNLRSGEIAKLWFTIDGQAQLLEAEVEVKRLKPPSNNLEEMLGMALSFRSFQGDTAKILAHFVERYHQGLKTASALLSVAEPDAISLMPLLRTLGWKDIADLGAVRFEVDRILTFIERINANERPRDTLNT